MVRLLKLLLCGLSTYWENFAYITATTSLEDKMKSSNNSAQSRFDVLFSATYGAQKANIDYT